MLPVFLPTAEQCLAEDCAAHVGLDSPALQDVWVAIPGGKVSEKGGCEWREGGDGAEEGGSGKNKG